MREHVAQLLTRYRNTGTLLDTNLLLLLLIGIFQRDLIPKFKRTRHFVKEDFDLLAALIANSGKIVTTPNILTETSNLSANLEEGYKSEYFKQFSRYIEILDEQFVSSKEIAIMDNFSRFGLTDMGIAKLSKENYLVITDDFSLAGYLEKNGIDVLNINHIRTLNWE